MCTDYQHTGVRGPQSYVVQPRFQFPDSFLSMQDIPDQDVHGPIRQEALMSSIVLFLSAKIPDAEIELVSCNSTVTPITDLNPYCRLVFLEVDSMKTSY